MKCGVAAYRLHIRDVGAYGLEWACRCPSKVHADVDGGLGFFVEGASVVELAKTAAFGQKSLKRGQGHVSTAFLVKTPVFLGINSSEWVWNPSPSPFVPCRVRTTGHYYICL